MFRSNAGRRRSATTIRDGDPKMNDSFNSPRRRAKTNTILCLVAALCIGTSVPGEAADPELKKFQGNWEVTDLIENGKVIAKERLRELLPSGGRAEIIEKYDHLQVPSGRKTRREGLQN